MSIDVKAAGLALQYPELPSNINTMPSASEGFEEESSLRILHKSDFQQHFLSLVSKFNLTTNATEAILNLLREFDVVNLPKTYRTLMGTLSGPLHISLKAEGSYYQVRNETVWSSKGRQSKTNCGG